VNPDGFGEGTGTRSRRRIRPRSATAGTPRTSRKSRCCWQNSRRVGVGFMPAKLPEAGARWAAWFPNRNYRSTPQEPRRQGSVPRRETARCSLRARYGAPVAAPPQARRPHGRASRTLPTFRHAAFGVLAHVLRDLHRAEMRPAHRAEVRDLGAVRRQRFVVEFARVVDRGEVELIFPAEFEPRQRERVVPMPRALVPLARSAACAAIL